MKTYVLLALSSLLLFALNVNAANSAGHLEASIIEQAYQSTNDHSNGTACYLRFSLNAKLPKFDGNLKIIWAFSENQNWTILQDQGQNSIAQLADCGLDSYSCISRGLQPGKRYFFAVREINLLNPSLDSSWSNEVECKVPVN